MVRLLSILSVACLLTTISFAEDAKPEAKKVDVGTQAPEFKDRKSVV